MSKLVLGAVLGLLGLTLVAGVDWRIALGVFLIVWGNNVQQGA